MRKLMECFRRKDNAGLTLVELIISMAILAIVGVAVGGAMFVSSRSYTRSSSEVNVQEEAQVASNLICDWLVDATSVNYDMGDQEITLASDGSNEFVIVHPDGNAEVTISIKLIDSDLTYTAVKSIPQDDGSFVTESSTGTLASNVTDAVFNSTFRENRNVKFSLNFKINERTYNAVTDSTSRNHSFVSTSGISGENSLYILPDNNVYTVGVDEYLVVLEPGQRVIDVDHDASFNFTFKVFGYDANTVVTVDGDSDYSQKDGVKFTLSQIEGTNEFTVNCQSNDNANAAPEFIFTAVNTAEPSIAHSIKVTCGIRRDTGVTFAYSGTGVFKATGEEGKNGSTYTAGVDLGVTYGPQYNAGFDKNGGYKNPYEVRYYASLDNGGGSYSVQELTNTSHPSYITDLVITPGSSSGNSTISFRLNADLDKDLYIVAVAAHSGSLTGVGAACKNVSFVDGTYSNNRVSGVLGAAFTYTGTSNVLANNNAYFGILKVAKAPNNNVTLYNSNVFQRGTPAFEIGYLTSEGYNYLTGLVQDDCDTRYALSDPYHPVNHDYRYVSAIAYRVSIPNYNAHASYSVGDKVTKAGDSSIYQCIASTPSPAGSFDSSKWTSVGTIDSRDDWSYYVLDRTKQPDELLQHSLTKMEGNESFIFDASTTYDYKLVYIAYEPQYKTELGRVESSIGTIPATIPYIYDPSDQKFKMDTYDSDSYRTFDVSEYSSITKPYGFYVYFGNMNVFNTSTDHPYWRIQQLVEDPESHISSWVDYTGFNLQWSDSYQSTDNLFNQNYFGIGPKLNSSDTYYTNIDSNVAKIRQITMSDGSVLEIGAYYENSYTESRNPDLHYTVGRIMLDKDDIKTENIGKYRILFGGDDGYQEPVGYNSGVLGYGYSEIRDGLGSVNSHQRVDCDLTGVTLDGTEYGYLYFEIKD